MTDSSPRSDDSSAASESPLRRAVSLVDRHLERIVILICYMSMAGIIFVEVLRRFFLNEQAAWSTTIPIYLFLWITWIGAARNVRLRTHLSFDELRARLPRIGQFLCLSLDAILWLSFGVIVIIYSTEQVLLSRSNFMIVQGTDHVMQWWFYVATPVAWGLLMIRTIQNWLDDLAIWRSEGEFHIRAVMPTGEETPDSSRSEVGSP